MHKKTLILVHPHFTLPGGAGNLLLEIGKRLAADFRVVVVAQSVRQDYIDAYPQVEFRPVNGPITSKMGFWLLLPYWRRRTHAKITEVIKEGGEPTLLANVFPAHWLSLGYRYKGKKIPSMWFCHEPSAFIHIPAWRKSITNPVIRTVANVLVPVLAWYDRRKVAEADRILVNSEFGKKAAAAVYGREGIVVYPGVDADKFKVIPMGEREDLVLTVCRLTKFKRVDLIVRSFAKSANNKAKLVIIGDGEEKENLRSLIKELGQEGRIEIRSGIANEELFSLYERAKLFVLASEEEPFGMVLLEAMAAGMPAIANNAGGPQEIIVSGETGSLIAMNEESLTAEIDRLLGDKALLERYGAAARERSVEVFSWDQSAKKLGGLL